MNTRKLMLFLVILLALVILQTTLLSGLSIRGVQPDFALLFLLFFAHILGPMEGKVMGFASGIVKDFLSLSPIGFHAVIDTTIGHVFGFSKEKMYIDPITLPVFLALVATIIKALWSFVLITLFIPDKLGSIFGVSLLVELGINAVAAPFVFAVLRILRLYQDRSHTMFE